MVSPFNVIFLFWILAKKKSRFSNFYFLFKRNVFVYLNPKLFFYLISFFFTFFVNVKKQHTLVASQSSSLSYFQKLLPYHLNYNYNFFLIKKVPSVLFITVDSRLAGYVYSYAKELNQFCYTGRWLPGKFTNRYLLAQQLYSFGFLDNRLLVNMPTMVFLIGDNTAQAFFEMREATTALIFGFVPVTSLLQLFDVSFPMNTKNPFFMVYLLELIKSAFKKLNRFF